MCFREVQCTRHACGHDHPQSDSRVRFGSRSRPVATTLITFLSASRWTADLRTVGTVRRTIPRVLAIRAPLPVSSGKQVVFSTLEEHH